MRSTRCGVEEKEGGTESKRKKRNLCSRDQRALLGNPRCGTVRLISLLTGVALI